MRLDIDLTAYEDSKKAQILSALASVFAGRALEIKEDTPTPIDEAGVASSMEAIEAKGEPKSDELPEHLKAGPIGYAGDDDEETDSGNSTAPAEATAAPAGATPSAVSGPAQVVSGPGNIQPSHEAPTNSDPNVDASGMPWDERIHVSTRTKMKSGKRAGCWKYKPGISDELKAQVEAELKASVTGAPAPQQPSPGPAAPPAQVQQPDPVQDEAPEQEGTVADNCAFNEPGHWPILLDMITKDVGFKKVPKGVAVSIANELGCANLMELGPQVDKYRAFADRWRAVRSMIELDPSVFDKAAEDWASVSKMIQG